MQMTPEIGQLAIDSKRSLIGAEVFPLNPKLVSDSSKASLLIKFFSVNKLKQRVKVTTLAIFGAKLNVAQYV
jgi:hypothetical protein